MRSKWKVFQLHHEYRNSQKLPHKTYECSSALQSIFGWQIISGRIRSQKLWVTATFEYSSLMRHISLPTWVIKIDWNLIKAWCLLCNIGKVIYDLKKKRERLPLKYLRRNLMDSLYLPCFAASGISSKSVVTWFCVYLIYLKSICGIYINNLQSIF